MAYVIRVGQLLAEAVVSGEKPAALEPFREERVLPSERWGKRGTIIRCFPLTIMCADCIIHNE